MRQATNLTNLLKLYKVCTKPEPRLQRNDIPFHCTVTVCHFLGDAILTLHLFTQIPTLIITYPKSGAKEQLYVPSKLLKSYCQRMNTTTKNPVQNFQKKQTKRTPMISHQLSLMRMTTTTSLAAPPKLL